MPFEGVFKGNKFGSSWKKLTKLWNLRMLETSQIAMMSDKGLLEFLLSFPIAVVYSIALFDVWGVRRKARLLYNQNHFGKH